MAASNGSIPVEFIPKSGIFGGFQLLGTPEVSKCTVSTFSAEINNRKSCRQMRFSSSKYTKMCLQPGLCPVPHWGSLQRSLRPPNIPRGLAAPPENRTYVLDPTALQASSFWPQRSCASLPYIKWVASTCDELSLW